MAMVDPNTAKDKFWNNVKILIGYLLAAAVAWTLLFHVSQHVGGDSDYWFNVLLLLFGGLLGWVTGILATPLDSKEKAKFSTYAAVISTFLTGFVAAKVDQAFKADAPHVDKQQLAQFMLFGAAFLLGLLCTFIGRLYVGTPLNAPSTQVSDGKSGEGTSPQGSQLPAKTS
ncbi:hypothetical protein AB4Y40_41680 [Paraburkholderia sp. EG287B]